MAEQLQGAASPGLKFDRITVGVGHRRSGTIQSWSRQPSGIVMYVVRFDDGAVATLIPGPDAVIERRTLAEVAELPVGRSTLRRRPTASSRGA